MRRLQGLLSACHLGPTLAVTAATTALAGLVGRGWGCVAVALAVLAGQLSVGWSNDWLDAARDGATRRTTKPIVAGLVSAQEVKVAALLAAFAAVPLSLLSGWRAAVVHLVAIASAWAYNAGLKATRPSPLPYVISFALLPAFVTLGPPTFTWPRPVLMAAAALLGSGVHFVNTLSDVEQDAITGVRGLPQRLGPRQSAIVGSVLLLCGLVVLRLVSPRLPGLSDLLVVVGCGATALVIVTAGRGRTAASQQWAILVGGLGVVLFAVGHPSLVG